MSRHLDVVTLTGTEYDDLTEDLREALEIIEALRADNRAAQSISVRYAQEAGELAARVSALEAELKAQREQEPVAFLCLLTNEDGEILLRRFRDAAKTFPEGWTVFGLPGRDYSDEFAYTEHPLYAAPVPPAVKESLTTPATAAVPDVIGIVHESVMRALDEVSVRESVPRGMAVEVAIEKARDLLAAQQHKGDK